MSNNCNTIHHWFDEMRKFSFPFNKQEIPKNGIYILFEKGEFGHLTNRIVRVGINKTQNRLASRLYDHFVKENKDGSIFRKNVGRAILSKDNDSFLEQWELNSSSSEIKNKYSKIFDFDKQQKIEKKVSEYIKNNFYFVVFEINDKHKRSYFESKIISTVSLCKECKPSEKWLGKFCPNENFQSKRTYNNCLKIKESGLWLSNELWKTPLNNDDLKELKTIIKQNK